MKLAPFLLLAACVGPARTAALGVTSTFALGADWAQTSRYTSECREANPILGQCGEHLSPHIYFPILMVANLAAGLTMGAWGDLSMALVTGAEGATVVGNWQDDKNEGR